MSHAYTNFVIALGENPVLRRTFARCAQTATAGHGLSDDDRHALREASQERGGFARSGSEPPKIIFFPNAVLG